MTRADALRAAAAAAAGEAIAYQDLGYQVAHVWLMHTGAATTTLMGGKSHPDTGSHAAIIHECGYFAANDATPSGGRAVRGMISGRAQFAKSTATVEKAIAINKTHQAAIERVAGALLKRRQLSGPEIRQLIAGYPTAARSPGKGPTGAIVIPDQYRRGNVNIQLPRDGTVMIPTADATIEKVFVKFPKGHR